MKKTYYIDFVGDVYIFEGRQKLAQRYLSGDGFKKGTLGKAWSIDEIRRADGKEVTVDKLPTAFLAAHPQKVVVTKTFSLRYSRGTHSYEHQGLSAVCGRLAKKFMGLTMRSPTPRRIKVRTSNEPFKGSTPAHILHGSLLYIGDNPRSTDSYEHLRIQIGRAFPRVFNHALNATVSNFHFRIDPIRKRQRN